MDIIKDLLSEKVCDKTKFHCQTQRQLNILQNYIEALFFPCFLTLKQFLKLHPSVLCTPWGPCTPGQETLLFCNKFTLFLIISANHLHLSPLFAPLRSNYKPLPDPILSTQLSPDIILLSLDKYPKQCTNWPVRISYPLMSSH